MHRLHAVHRRLSGRRDPRRAKAHACGAPVVVLRMRTVRGAVPGRLHFAATGGTRLEPQRCSLGPRSLRGSRNAAGAQRTHRQARGPRHGGQSRRPIVRSGRRWWRPHWRGRARAAQLPRRSHEYSSQRLRETDAAAVPGRIAAGSFRRHEPDFTHRFFRASRQAVGVQQARGIGDTLSRRACAPSARFARGPRDLDADRAHAGSAAAIRGRRCDTRRRRAEARPGAGARAHPLFAGTRPHAQLRRRQARGDRPVQRRRSRCRIAIQLPGADFYRVDALHMLGIATPAGRAARLESQGAGRRGSVVRPAGARLGRIAEPQHRLVLFRLRRRRHRARLLAESAAAARGAGQCGEHPGRQVDDRARISRHGQAR